MIAIYFIVFYNVSTRHSAGMNSIEHYSIKQDSIYPTETIGFQIMEVCIMSKYSLKTIKNKARAAGYRVSKGFQHYLCSGAVCRDCNGEPYTGYIVEDLSTGFLVWGCYDSNYDHLWTLEDVEEFIKGEYEKAEIEY